MKCTLLPCLVLLLALSAPGHVQAQPVPALINHEGLLLDEDGLPMEGLVTLRLSLYEQAQGGNVLWFEEYQVQLIDGYYVLRLGEQSDLSGLFDGESRYLGISVNHGPELAPRHCVVSVPYAMVAQNAVGDITPQSIWVGGLQVIDHEGNWVGPPVPGAGDGVGYETPEEVLAALRTVDGEGSALDADLLDGHEGHEFVRGSDQLLALLRSVDGQGSGVDADRLDGLDSSQFVRSAQQVHDLLVTVDGSGSSVDADRLDGLDSSRFMRSDQDTGTTGGLQVDGDLLVGGDQELLGQLVAGELRLVPGARLGLGVEQPQVELDVAGGVRASGIIQASGGLKLGNHEGECTQAKAGLLRWTGQALEVCDGEAWRSTCPGEDSGGDGSSRAEAGRSCAAILAAGLSRGDRVYWIDPRGGSTEDAFSVYCDMTMDGGGWAKVLQYADAAYTPTAGGAGNIAVQGIGGFAKLADARINAIGGRGNVKIYRISGDRTPKKVFIRTDAIFDDTARAMGLVAGPFEACESVSMGSCVFRTIRHSWIDTLHWGLVGDNQDRYFADHDHAPQCYRPRDNSRRCFCSGASLGYVRIDQVSIWMREPYVDLPGSPELPAASCKQILDAGASHGDGLYWLDPDGNGGGAPFEAYCDMTTAQGGWTRFFQQTMAEGTFNRTTVGMDVSRVRTDTPLPPLSWVHDNCPVAADKEFLLKGFRADYTAFILRSTTQANMFEDSAGYTCYETVDIHNDNRARSLVIIRKGSYRSPCNWCPGAYCGTSTRSFWTREGGGSQHLEYTFHEGDHYRRIGTTDNNDLAFKRLELYFR